MEETVGMVQTLLVLMLMKEMLGESSNVRNLGDVRWLATEDRSVGKGTGRHIACFILDRS